MTDETLDETAGGVRPEEYVAETTGGQHPEVEAEKKEKTLEEQVAIYAEIYKVEPDKIMEMVQTKQAEMSEDEKKDFSLMIFSPEGKTTMDVWRNLGQSKPNSVFMNMGESGITSKEEVDEGEPAEAEVVFTRYNLRPDDDTLGENHKDALELEETDKKWMTPKQWIIACDFFLHDGRQHIDEKTGTIFPNFRTSGGGIPAATFVSHGHTSEIRFNSMLLENDRQDIGAREVK